MRAKSIVAAADVATLETVTAQEAEAPIRLFSVEDLMKLDAPAPTMLVEGIIPATGASLIFGAPKSNKTLVAIQMAIAIASGNAFLDFYKILEPGPVLVIEQDDPAGPASIKEILQRSAVPTIGIPFRLATKIPYTFGTQLLEWLEEQIVSQSLRLIVVDSYTALRASRRSGIDIVKAEQTDLTMMDELAKRMRCAIVIIHHSSKGSAGLDWSDQAAGTFAMSAATEAQIHLSRYKDLEMNAPERLLRVRGRHQSGLEMVLRFREETLDHVHVLEGGAAGLYPLLKTLRSIFAERNFSPRELSHETGISKATAHRQIERLHQADALVKRGFGEYALRQ